MNPGIDWNIVGALAGVAAVLIALVQAGQPILARRRAHRRQTASTAAGRVALAQVADQLAVALRSQWEAEAAHQRLHDPHPLPVAWLPTDPSLVEPWHELVTTAERWPGGPPTNPTTWATGPAELAGADTELTNVLARVPTRRLVVLGEPGAGKTTLLVRLLLDLLARRAPGSMVPVPVLVSLAAWNPVDDDLATWLARRLTLDHPGLAAPAPPEAGATSRARALLDHRLLLPILDGLDELPDQLVGRAITRLNSALPPGQGLVLASRTAAYRQATTDPAPQGAPRAPGSVPVRLWGAAAITLQPLAPVDVRGYLRRDAATPAMAERWEPVLAVLGTSTPVGRTLTSPLLVTLARTIYNPRPGDLPASLPDPAELCDQTRFPTPAAIQVHLCDAFIRAAYRPHPDPHRNERWTAEQAGRWLEFLARHLHRDRDDTIDLAWWQLRYAIPPLVPPVVSGLVSGLAGGLTTGLAVGLKNTLAFAIAAGLLVGLAGVVVVGLAAGLAARRQPKAPVRGLHWSNLRARDLIVVLAIGLVFGLTADAGLVAGLVAGLATALWRGLATTPADLTTAADPRTVLARDRRAFIQVVLVSGLAVGLMAGPGGVLGALVAGLVFALTGGLGAGLWETAWGWFGIARCWLAARRRLPWRLMSFLADAHQRGVLRQAGAVYQFRHVELQRRLATRPR